MSLRVINVILPAASVESFQDALAERGVLDSWTQPLNTELCLAGMVVRTESSESVIDALQQRFGSVPRFRVLLLALEATIPRVEEPTPEDATAAPRSGGAATAAPTALRVSREELINDLADGTRLTWVFVITAILAAIVAAVGLVRDNVAVLIGAMVIAPLLTPNAALALATTLGDLEYGRRALTTNVVGVALVLGLSILIGQFAPFDPAASEVASRTVVGLGDLALALAAGVAGALAYTTGVASGLIGVMVAVALVPPLVAAGLLIGAGEFALAGGAILLVATNVICVNLAGVVTFLAQGIRPRTWWEADRARRATRVAVLLWTGLLVLLALLILIAQE